MYPRNVFVIIVFHCVEVCTLLIFIKVK